MSKRRTASARAIALALVLPLAAGLQGCSQDMSDLEAWVEQTQSRPGGRIDPLPTVKPYNSFVYSAEGIRSPFMPESRIAQAQRQDSGLRPDRRRNREHLESFPLDTLRMVGSLERAGSQFALVQDNEGLIHTVQPGNYLGENDGRITAITESEIRIVEIVPDGLGGYIERPAAIALNE